MNYTLKLILLLSLVFVPASKILTQEGEKEKYIIEADKTEGIMEGEERVIIGTGNVKITHGKLVITCDKGTSYEKQDLAILEKNVVIDDPDKGYHLTAGYVEYHKNDKHSIATQTPILTIKKEEEPIRVESELMEMFSEDDIGIARGNVWIYYQDIIAQCDLATYYGKEETIVLEGDPVAWQDESRLAGEVITLYIKDDEVDKIFINGGSRMIYYTREEKEKVEDNMDGNKITDETGENIEEPSNPGEEYITPTPPSITVPEEVIMEREEETGEEETTGEGIENKGEKKTTGRVDTYGDVMTAYFEDGEVVRVLIEGNAEGIYYPYENGEPTDERVFASGNRIDVSLRDEQVERIRITGDVSGFYDPGKEGGQTRVYGDVMVIFIADNEVDKIIIRGKAKGIYYHGREEEEKRAIKE